jgi:hypothetical protein
MTESCHQSISGNKEWENGSVKIINAAQCRITASTLYRALMACWRYQAFGLCSYVESLACTSVIIGKALSEIFPLSAVLSARLNPAHVRVFPMRNSSFCFPMHRLNADLTVDLIAYWFIRRSFFYSHGFDKELIDMCTVDRLSKLLLIHVDWTQV